MSAARRPTCCCTEAKYGGSACTDQSTLLSAGAVGCTARACSPAQSGCRRSRDRPSPWRRAVCHICIGTGPTPPTHWDWAHPGFGDNEVEIWLGLCYDLRADAPLEPLRNMPSCMLSAKSHAMRFQGRTHGTPCVMKTFEPKVVSKKKRSSLERLSRAAPEPIPQHAARTRGMNAPCHHAPCSLQSLGARWVMRSTQLLSPGAEVTGVSPVWCRCDRGEPSRGADVTGVSPVVAGVASSFS